jgi:hypothetical protein
VTAYLLLKIAKKFGNNALGTWALIFLLGNQPFVFDLLPWPSAHAMLLSAGTILLALNITDEPEKNSTSNLKRSFSLGLIIPTIILTRAQIGLLLGLCVSVWLFQLSKRRLLPLFALGFILTSIFLGSVLNHFGWLIVSLKDEFIFGATYIGQGENPKPLFTILGTLLLVSFYYISLKVRPQLRTPSVSKGALWASTTTLFSLALLLFSQLVNSRNLDLYSLSVLVFRRLWISALLASVLIFALNELLTFKPKNAAKEPQGAKTQQRKLLAVFGLIAQFQIYPLFDQMHSWWGSIPGVLIMAILISESIRTFQFSMKRISHLKNLTALLILIICIVPWSIQIFQSRASIAPSGINLIWTSNIQAREMNTLQAYFKKTIPAKSSVLNLCPESDVFFSSGLFSASTRQFIFWPRFHALKYMKKDFINANPDYVVSCHSEVEADYRIDLDKFEALYGRNFSKKVLVSYRQNLDGRDWQIWKIKL